MSDICLSAASSFRIHGVCGFVSTHNFSIAAGESSDIFQKALDDGYLDICMVSVIFVGLNNSLTVNAKHAVFQDPSDTTLTVYPVNHEIYFNVTTDTKKFLKKLQHDDFDGLLLSSVSDNRVEQIPEDEHKHLVQEEKLVYPQLADHSKAVSLPHVISQTELPQVTEHLKVSGQTEPPQPSLHELSKETKMAEVDSDDEHVNDASDFNNFIQHFRNRFKNKGKNKGKAEFYHVFDFHSHHQIIEVYKIFIRNVSLCVLVTEASETIHPEEITILQNISSSSKGLVIESCDQEANIQKKDAKSGILHHFSNCLVKNDDQSYLFSMNCMKLEKSDRDVGDSILAHALSSSSSTTFPFSWYLFGFRLVQIMNRKHTASVLQDCMKIASELNMNRPTVEAALEHLMERNIILYFRDILKDTVFLGVRIFSCIFSAIIEKCNRHMGTISQSDFDYATNGISKHVSSSDFFTLFMKLMVIAPYNSSADRKYLMPSLLALLNETTVNEICCDCDLNPVYFKCPSPGYEFITMLIAFLLNLPSGNWQIREDNTGYPMCLHKNCVQFIYDGNIVITISFVMGQIEVYAKSQKSVSDVSAIILQGFEKIKLTLNSYNSFTFNMSFPCHCGKTDHMHSATYNSGSGLLNCENDKSISSEPTSAITRWIDISGNKLGHVFVNNIFMTLCSLV